MIPEFPSQGCIWAARNTSQVGTYPQINISVFTLINPNEIATVNSLVRRFTKLQWVQSGDKPHDCLQLTVC